MNLSKSVVLSKIELRFEPKPTLVNGFNFDLQSFRDLFRTKSLLQQLQKLELNLREPALFPRIVAHQLESSGERGRIEKSFPLVQQPDRLE